MLFVYGGILVLFLALAALSRDVSTVLVGYMFAALVTAALFLPRIRQAILVTLGLIATGLMLTFFGEFLLYVDEHDAPWYQSGNTIEGWCSMIAGFGMVVIIAGFSCRLKENASFESKNEWIGSIANIRRRLQEFRPSS